MEKENKCKKRSHQERDQCPQVVGKEDQTATHAATRGEYQICIHNMVIIYQWKDTKQLLLCSLPDDDGNDDDKDNDDSDDVVDIYMLEQPKPINSAGLFYLALYMMVMMTIVML